MPELHRPCVTQEAVSLVMCAVLTVVRGVRLMVMVTIMRHWMMGNMVNMASIVAVVCVVMARVLEMVSPLARLPGVQQTGGGGRGALEREY